MKNINLLGHWCVPSDRHNRTSFQSGTRSKSLAKRLKQHGSLFWFPGAQKFQIDTKLCPSNIWKRPCCFVMRYQAWKSPKTRSTHTKHIVTLLWSGEKERNDNNNTCGISLSFSRNCETWPLLGEPGFLASTITPALRASSSVGCRVIESAGQT